ncbi:MAG: hypothetical protein E6590_08150 [Clostridiales bacterium]|uniref:DUF4365 domain-containing protein n=1 Tax=Zhenhengia yiwuensis TaxID=2763666 RepID=A0A926EES8_9FIRM|nr:hypothetical protein [Zhenhengia yiwuensis]MBC8578974.1 hypothetical protein [Zhenhengia yiwuensis]MDU6359934.1 hypothetical protein [Clostridiales bacterium]
MNSTLIERIAVQRVEDEVIENEELCPEIPVNDKSPSFDGEILVYNSGSHKKSNLVGKVPVQVKGKHVEQLSEKIRKYSIERADLENYFKAKGVIFFVVEITEKKSYRVFYKSLLPVDIKRILNETQGKSKTIEFQVLEQTKLRLNTICRHFLTHQEAQYTTINFAIEDMPSETAIFTTTFPNVGDEMWGLETYMYMQKDKHDIPHPIMGKFKMFLEKKRSVSVGVDGKIYFNKINIIESKDLQQIKIGQNTILDLANRKIEMKIIGKLEDSIQELTFIIEVMRKGKMEIDGMPITFIMDKTEDELKEWEKQLYQLKLIKDILDYLKIEKQLELQGITKQEINHLNLLKRGIVDKEELIPIEIECSAPYVLEIRNLNILIFMDKQKNKVNIYDFFDLVFHHKVKVTGIFEGETIQTNLFALFNDRELIGIDNINFGVILKAIKDTPISKKHTKVVILQTLTYIANYDLSGDKRFLQLVLDIYEWIKTLEVYEDVKDVVKINEMQIIRRLRSFNEEEEIHLIEYKKELGENELPMLLAVAILLESKTEVKIYIKQLPQQEIDYLKKMPIYTLGQQLGVIEE